MAAQQAPAAPALPRHQGQLQLPLRRRGAGPGDLDEDALARASLDALGDLLELVVVGGVDVAKVPDQVARLQPSRGGGAPWRHRVDLCEGVAQPLWDVVPQGGLGGGRRRGSGGCGGGDLGVGGALGEAGKVLVDVLLDPGHEVLVVVAQVDDAGAGGADLGDVDVGAGEAVRGQEARVHVDAVRVEHAAQGPELGLDVVLGALELGEGEVRRVAVCGPGRGRPRGDGGCVEVVHSQREAHLCARRLLPCYHFSLPGASRGDRWFWLWARCGCAGGAGRQSVNRHDAFAGRTCCVRAARRWTETAGGAKVCEAECPNMEGQVI